MKKNKFWLLVALAIFCLNTNAQTDTFVDINKTIDTFFSKLDTNLISSGYIHDKVIHRYDYNQYRGNPTHDTLANQLDWYNINDELFHMKQKYTNRKTSKEYIELAHWLDKQGINPILILNYKYQKLRDSSFEKGLIDTNSGFLFESSNTDPYVTEEIFVATPAFVMNNTGSCKYLVSRLFYSGNISLTNTRLKIDFGDGQGFIAVNWEETVIINYPTNGIHSVKIKIETIDPNTNEPIKSLLGIAMFRAKLPDTSDPMPTLSPAEILFDDLVSDSSYGNIEKNGFTFTFYYNSTGIYDEQYFDSWDDVINFCNSHNATLTDFYPKKITVAAYGHGLVSVVYGKGNVQSHPYGNGCYFKKPLIFIDGVDFGYKTRPTGCQNGKCGTLGFEDIRTGKDYDLETGATTDLQEFKKGPYLMEQLYQNGYDVMFLDFHDGADYMQRNAMVLVKLIQWINAHKCSEDELVIIGPSMGGQVLRYALCYMEKYSMPHCTRDALFFDSPHKGANIMLGLQHALKKLGDVNPYGQFGDAKDAIDRKLNRPGARQLLNQHFGSSNASSKTQESINFYDSLENYWGDFPKLCRKVAVASGSITGDIQQYTEGNNNITTVYAGEKVAELNMKIPLVNGVIKILTIGFVNASRVNAKIWSQCGGDEGQISTVKLPGIGNDNINYITSRPANCAEWDNSPGGQNNAVGALDKSFSIFKNNSTILNVGIVYKKRFSFIPTISSLCIRNNPSPWFNVKNNVADFNVPNSYYHPFDAIMGTEYWSEMHVEMTEKKIDWLITELEQSKNDLDALPKQLGSATINNYNFGSYFKNRLYSININNACSLTVNKYATTSYNNGVVATDGSYFYLNSVDCGANINILSGGSFLLGDNNTPTNNKGIVTINRGSNIYLRNGSNLYLHFGSKLIIEKGATLFVDPGANIYLEDNATIEIKGQLNLSNNAVFKHNGSGKVIFNNTDGNFTIGAASGSSIEFTSTKNETKLEVSGAITIPNTLSMFKVNGATVVANTGAKFDIYSPVYFDNGIFKPSSNNTNNNWGGLKFYNQIDNQIHIDQSKFYYANTALDFSVDYALNTPSFYRNEFYNNNLAMYIHDAGFTLNNCIFKENVKGIKANWITLSSTIQGCRFKDNTLGIDYHGNINALLLLKNNNIITSDIDIVASSSYPYLVTMGCNKFTNTNIDIDYASLNLSSSTLHNTSDYGGFNVFKESPIGLYYINCLNLKDGNNDFIMTGNVYINGSISNSNSMSSSQCNNNYFDRINGGAYALPNGIAYNYYYGKLNISYLNANTQVSSNFKLYGTLATQQNGGCQSTGGGLAPNISENYNRETPTTSKLYPNPTDELLNIEMPPSEGTTKITVIDMQGKTVFSGQLAAGTQLYTLPVKELPAGVYMMMLEREGTVEKQRFVRQ